MYAFSNLPFRKLSKHTDKYFSTNFKDILEFLRGLIALRKFDLIYSYKGHFLQSIFGRILFGKKLIYDFQTSPIRQDFEFAKIGGSLNWKKKIILYIERKLYELLLAHTDLIVTISEDIKKMISESYNVPSEKIYVLPLGVDFEKFNPEKFDDIPSFNGRSASMVCVSSIQGKWRAKGIETVVKGLKCLKDRGLIVSFTIIGSIPTDIIDYLNKYAEERGVKDLLQFEGYVPHENIPKVLSKYDITVSPIPDLESYRGASPAKVFEYLAMKKIVIASNVTCHTKIIDHNYNGILYEPENPRDFASKVESIITNPQLREKIRKNTRESVRDHAWNSRLSNLNEYIQKILTK